MSSSVCFACWYFRRQGQDEVTVGILAQVQGYGRVLESGCLSMPSRQGADGAKTSTREGGIAQHANIGSGCWKERP